MEVIDEIVDVDKREVHYTVKAVLGCLYVCVDEMRVDLHGVESPHVCPYDAMCKGELQAVGIKDIICIPSDKTVAEMGITVGQSHGCPTVGVEWIELCQCGIVDCGTSSTEIQAVAEGVADERVGDGDIRVVGSQAITTAIMYRHIFERQPHLCAVVG